MSYKLKGILILVIALLLVGCGGSVKEIGSYTEDKDMTMQVVRAGEKWLSDAWMSEKVNVEDFVQDITVSVNVILYSDGTYSYAVDEESYNTALESARNGVANALSELIIIRFNAAGKGKYTEEMINDLMVDSLGMSAVDYVNKYGPNLLPSLDELKNEWEISGNYKEVQNENNK